MKISLYGHIRIIDWMREDYDLMREIMHDGDQFPDSFDEWFSSTSYAISSIVELGGVPDLVTFDISEFVSFCEIRGLRKDSEARSQFLDQMS